MSKEDVELVRRTFEAFGEVEWASFVRDTELGDLQAIVEEIYDPGVEIQWMDTSPDSGPYHGHQGAVEAFTEWLASFDEFRFEATEFIDADTSVVVPNRQRGVGKGSGAPVEMTTAWLVEVKDGRISRLREYSSRERALEAAAARE